MNATENAVKVVKDIEVLSEQEKHEVSTKLEESIKTYFMNKDIAKERNEENKMLLEDIQAEFDRLNTIEVVIELPDGEYGRIMKKSSFKEVLDKEILALRINEVSNNEQAYITKDDLKTPWDFSMLTKQDRITPKLIAECTENLTTMQTKVSRLKRKPKASKN